ncbi:MAG: hypothetical protein HS108_00290 [Planctomycetes bacterium]|jgi:hypothetical protein|nr:hypothetical protein [Planctomycetota bacterium]MCL4729484.1 hypothetical protein [Planctomycetota bacterium]
MRLVLAVLCLALAASLSAQDTATHTQIRPAGLRFWTEGFELNLETLVQFRLTVQDERGGNDTNGRDFYLFRVPRARLSLYGHIFEPMLQYRVQLNFVRQPAEFIEVARFRLALGSALNLNAGQDRVVWDWERRVPGQNLRFVERAYVNEVFHQDWGKGLWVDGAIGAEAPLLKYWLGVYNGVLRGDNDFRNKDGAQNADSFTRFVDGEVMVSMRLETQPLGALPTGLGDNRAGEEHGKPQVAAGVGFNYFTSGFNDGLLRGDTASVLPASGRPRTQQETVAFVVDAHGRWYGASLDAAFYARMTNFSNRGSNRYSPRGKQGIGDLFDWGWSIEGGYFILPRELGVFVRVNALNADEFWGSDGVVATAGHQRAIRPDAMEYGLAVNYHFQGDRLKFSLDINYVDQQLAYPYDRGFGTGLLGVYNRPPARSGALGSHPANDDHNVIWIVRLQIQWIL